MPLLTYHVQMYSRAGQHQVRPGQGQVGALDGGPGGAGDTDPLARLEGGERAGGEAGGRHLLVGVSAV